MVLGVCARVCVRSTKRDKVKNLADFKCGRWGFAYPELTCAEAVLVSGAVAVKGEGGARESAACCCCWDISELAAPMVMAPAPDVGPSVPENTPAIRSATTTLPTPNAEQRNVMVLQAQLLTPLPLMALDHVFSFINYFITCNNSFTRFKLARRCCHHWALMYKDTTGG